MGGRVYQKSFFIGLHVSLVWIILIIIGIIVLIATYFLASLIYPMQTGRAGYTPTPRIEELKSEFEKSQR